MCDAGRALPLPLICCCCRCRRRCRLFVAACSATPNTYVYRPADGNETSAAYACAISNSHAPAILAFSRQNLPHLPGSTVEKAMKGGYTVFDSTDAAGGADGAAAGKPDLVIAATGSEVSIAIDSAKAVAASTGKRVAVASLPCLEVFEEQPEEYKASVLPPGVPVLTVEALAVRGWERYGHAWVGLTTFGHSGPYLVSGPRAHKMGGSGRLARVQRPSTAWCRLHDAHLQPLLACPPTNHPPLPACRRSTRRPASRWTPSPPRAPRCWTISRPTPSPSCRSSRPPSKPAAQQHPSPGVRQPRCPPFCSPAPCVSLRRG